MLRCFWGKSFLIQHCCWFLGKTSEHLSTRRILFVSEFMVLGSAQNEIDTLQRSISLLSRCLGLHKSSSSVQKAGRMHSFQSNSPLDWLRKWRCRFVWRDSRNSQERKPSQKRRFVCEYLCSKMIGRSCESRRNCFINNLLKTFETNILTLGGRLD